MRGLPVLAMAAVLLMAGCSRSSSASTKATFFNGRGNIVSRTDSSCEYKELEDGHTKLLMLAEPAGPDTWKLLKYEVEEQPATPSKKDLERLSLLVDAKVVCDAPPGGTATPPIEHPLRAELRALQAGGKLGPWAPLLAQSGDSDLPATARVRVLMTLASHPELPPDGQLAVAEAARKGGRDDQPVLEALLARKDASSEALALCVESASDEPFDEARSAFLLHTLERGLPSAARKAYLREAFTLTFDDAMTRCLDALLAVPDLDADEQVEIARGTVTHLDFDEGKVRVLSKLAARSDLEEQAAITIADCVDQIQFPSNRELVLKALAVARRHH